jgi:hypothetical protein
LTAAVARKIRRKPLDSLETRPEMARALTPALCRKRERGRRAYLAFFAIASSFSARMVLRWSAASFFPSMPKATAISCE